MSKFFTLLTQNFSVNIPGHTACPSVVCSTSTNINDIKNKKDDLANAGSFSFIKKAWHPELLEGQLLTNNLQPKTTTHSTLPL